ncbi:MAG: TonB-dependent receptor [Lewinellaceae bacterium]|nr:TonB-dependent receptor [Lewinellaceae bacterium]
MKRILLFAFSLLLTTGMLWGQTTLKGRLEATGHVVVGATVSLKPVDLFTITDQQGRFRFDNIAAGSYTLEISGVDIAPLSYPVEPTNGETLEVVLTAQPAEKALTEVTVYGSRDFRGIGRLPEAGILQVNAGKKMEVVPLNSLDANLAANNTRQIFAKVPGTHIWESDASGIQVSVATRGLSPNRSWEYNVRQNGYDVSADPLGYPEAYYNPPMEAVDKVEVIRGAASLQWGPQFGGLLNYQLRRAPEDRKISLESRQTVGSYGMFSSYNAVGGTVGKFDYVAYFHHRDGAGWRENSRYTINHGFLRLGYQFSPKFRAEAEYTRTDYKSQQAGGLTDTQFAADARQSARSRNWFSTPWNLASARLQYDFSPKTHLELKVFGLFSQRNSIGFVRAINIPDTINLATGTYNPRQLDRDQYNNWGSELRFLTNYTIGGREQTLATGLRYFDGYTHRRQSGLGDTGSEFSTDLRGEQYPRDLEFDTRNTAAFAEHIFRVGKRFSLVPGFRVENVQNNAEGRINISGAGVEQNMIPEQRTRTFLLAGFGAEYHATATSEVYANISQSYRPVAFADLTPPATTAVIDPSMKDARGWVADFGYRGRWKDVLNFDVSVFYLRYADRIGTIARLAGDGSVYQYRTNLSTSIHQGVESYLEINPLALITTAKRFGALNLFASLAWTDARFTDLPVTTVSNGVITETNLKDKFVDNAPRYVHRFGATFAREGFSATWQLSSVGAVFTDAANTDAASANGQTGRIPGYEVQDLSATWHFLHNYSLRAGVNNLADVRYATRRAGGYPGPGLLPGEGRTWYAGLGVRF